jgi:hypothetical protein
MVKKKIKKWTNDRTTLLPSPQPTVNIWFYHNTKKLVRSDVINIHIQEVVTETSTLTPHIMMGNIIIAASIVIILPSFIEICSTVATGPLMSPFRL